MSLKSTFCSNTIILCLTLSFLSACKTAPELFDTSFNRTEIANFTSVDFDIEMDAAEQALKPTYKKYGAPHAYVFGHMSSVFDPNLSRLYGSGEIRTKLQQNTHTFWAINGDALSEHYNPIKTAHLIYDINDFEDVTNIFNSIGTLTNRGQVFTIFERKYGEKIIVTLHKTDDLPKDTHFNSLQFYKG